MFPGSFLPEFPKEKWLIRTTHGRNQLSNQE